jgi:hypothetical protein
MPEKTNPIDALKLWAELNLPDDFQLDHLVSAAENLELAGDS